MGCCCSQKSGEDSGDYESYESESDSSDSSVAKEDHAKASKASKESQDLHQPKTKASGGGATAASSPAIIAKKVEQAKKTGALALRECGLKKLPPSATDDGAGAFRTVDVTGNQLKELPEGVGAWSGLQNLLCSRNQLQELPAGMGQLVNLKKLVLTDNRLARLPAGLAQLTKLATLQLDGNRLGPSVGDVFPSMLEELDLSRNQLKELPDTLGGLGALTRLVLTGNELRELPASLGGLAKLQYLDAADNLLSGVPAQLLEGTSLSELWLKGNPMDRLKLQETPGFSAFMERRKARLDARIDAKVVGAIDLAVCGLD